VSAALASGRALCWSGRSRLAPPGAAARRPGR
jgi:hypothetical protein